MARPSIDSSACLSPIMSPTASVSDLSSAYPPRSASARPPNARRVSSASSVASHPSSVGTALDWRFSKEFGGGVAGGGSNSTAISVLADSQNSRAAATRPRPGEIPPVNLTSIPKLKPSAFTFSFSIAPEYDRFQRAKDQGLEEMLRLSKKPAGIASSIAPSASNITALDDDTASIRSTTRRRSRKGSLALAPLQTVPAVYFDENFRLENPRTFDVVSERSEVIRSPPVENGDQVSAIQTQRKALATNAILQEKLSWYMDTVEVHLIQSISTASTSFFAALGDLRQLHNEATASVQKIQALRSELVRLDEEQAIKGLEIVRLRRRRDNVAKLERAVKQIERVTKSIEKVEKSLDHHQIDAALDAILETERLLAGEGEKGLIDLRGVRSLEAVTSDLNHLRYRIGKAYEARFVQCLLDDLRSHIEKVPQQETLRRFSQAYQRDQYNRFLSSKVAAGVQPPPRSSSLPPEYSLMSDSLRQLLKQHLDGLQRANHINEAVQSYRDAVIKEAKNLIRRNLPNDGDADSVASSVSHISSRTRPRGLSSTDKSMALSRALRNLGPLDAEDLLVKTYTGASELIRRLGTQQKMLLDATMQMGETGVGGMLSPRLEQNGFSNGPNGRGRSESDPTISMDISDLISSAVEISQSHIVKVVKVRTEQVSHYPPEYFLRYYILNRLFSQECEALSVRATPALQNAVFAQMKEFLNIYQAEKIRGLAECLEKDKWAAKEVSADLQASLDRIVASATADPEDWLAVGRLWEPVPLPQAAISPAASLAPSATPSAVPTPAATPAPDAAPSSSNHLTVPSLPTIEIPTTPSTSEPPASKTHAFIGQSKFILPQSGLLVLRDIESYLRLVTLAPALLPDLASHILDFLRLFNSRTFQLILGAGATRSAGLRSITTKHLALSSQALSIITTIIPFILATLSRISPPSAQNLAVDFEKLRKSTGEYQNEIHSKLVSIMADRARSHANIMRSLDWDHEWQGEREKYWVEVICRETGVLYKVLNKHLPVEQVRGIMGPVFADYRGRLVEGFMGGVTRTEEGKERMLRDAETFKQKLGALEGAGNSAEIILEAVRNKIVTPNAPPPQERIMSPPPQQRGGMNGH
ncbi:Vps54-like protein-domain-containing protein [Pyronema domesticum]|uniref:Similar to Vacuolar protein sorting-associated protein 54 acc. no. Q12071 n=1 Tax=Pyronema omphalodes (strain CBS 100304) TaxID=1076935 RepID=U4KXH9_PYROM|nr:Vps54-like protein-domain-containing protein [Pyronema domesticum]CCX06200.1 Similar to Vacuolar protein sorting-associated protein 54; acc. no. Q12071 [Pyronema omphalodes CBS 100304]